MFRWNFILRKLSNHVSPRAQRQSRCARTTKKPRLEVLEDRTLLSASGMESQSDASAEAPAPPPVVAMMVQQEVQTIAEAKSEFKSLVTIAMQEIAQGEAYFVQLATNLYDDISGLVITFIAPPNVPSGSGTTTVNNAAPQQPNIALQQTGSGAITTPHENAPTEGAIKPMVDGGGVQPDAGGGGGAGGNPNATVSGQVWLDNNGDGDEDDGEQGFSGITVYLDITGQGTMTTTTDANGNYTFAVYVPPGTTAQCQIQVVIPQFDEATIEDSESDINTAGLSPVFALSPNEDVDVPAGIRSMHVTTAQDDANGAIKGQVTLRDAIATGNNGGGNAVTFAPNVTGTIDLQAALPTIQKSYNINGPGSSTLQVDGNGGSSNPYRIFAINAGITTTISGLEMSGGYIGSGNGGGILNNGNLTLANDEIDHNTTTSSGRGGGIFNATGAVLTVTTDTITTNQAGGGGGIYNAGTLTIGGDSSITLNSTYTWGGGGIFNSYGKITATGNTIISVNTDYGLFGGGVYNAGGSFLMRMGSISYNTEKSGGGGGVLNSGGTMTLTGVGIQQNVAKAQGGGIYVGAGKVTLNNGFSIGGGNKASSGGGMFIRGGTVKMSGGQVSGNSAISSTGGGGGVYVSSGSLTITNLPITDNNAMDGGGMYINGGTVKVSGVGITDNTFFQDGGGVFVNGGTLTLKGAYKIQDNLPGNETSGSGDGMFIAGGKVTMSGGSVSQNKSHSGGGIYNLGGSLTLNKGVEIVQNVAQSIGGGMLLSANSTTTFNGVTVQGNTAEKKAKGVYQSKSATVIPKLPAPPALSDKDDPNGTPFTGA